MSFESFRVNIEKQLNSFVKFELLEFHYQPYSFGDGILAYRIKGQNHKFVFDGRENELTWFRSKPHEKFFGGSFEKFKIYDGFEISISDLENGINNSA